MGSKVLLLLVMFMAAILLISAEVAPNEYENFNTKNGKAGSNGIYENKGYWGGPYYGGGWGGPYYGGGWGGPWRGGWGGPWRGGWGWGGGWRPNEHVQAGINANPHN